MALKFKTVKAKSISYGATRNLNDIEYIVIHYTSNNGDTAKNNADYFADGNIRQAGAHVFVDGGTYVYKSVPLSKVAWAVGGLYTQKNGAGKYYKKCTNTNSLSIEMCNCAKTIPTKVYNQTVELTKYYMKKYGIPASRVIRHWDVNGKDCPSPWASKNNSGWKKFKKDISASTTLKPKKESSTAFKSYKVKVTASALNIRKSASTSASKVGSYKKNMTVTIKAVKNGWGQTSKGWICLRYTKKC